MNSLVFDQVAVGAEVPALKLRVTTTAVIAGALASRDYSPLHHDYHYVTAEAGHPDIFLNTPHQAALFERLLSDWAGPRGRLGRMKFAMKSSVYAGNDISISGRVTAREIDKSGCGWLTLTLEITAVERVKTTCEARYALPVDATDNPWLRKGEEWQP